MTSQKSSSRGFDLSGLQSLGRALMLPIAVLPAAGLILRLGQPDVLNLPFVASAANAIFAGLGLLFAIGVAVGLARENHGAAGLAGAVAFIVTTEGAKVLLHVPPEVTAGFSAKVAGVLSNGWKVDALQKLGVPIGIICGLTAGGLFNRYGDLKLPEFLAFFGGRRFVPIAAGVFGLVYAAVLGYAFEPINLAIKQFSEAIISSGSLGYFLFGAMNRLLIVTGLHHILNNVAWFVVGEYHGATGDINRFIAGDPTAGGFMAGFFPVIMFGLPAACLAMYHTARPERRAEVGGMLLSLSATSFLTGVTEPIEFSFMFLAPVLYAAHILLTGLAMSVMDFLHVKLGFNFSAGFIDYALNYTKATNPLYLVPVGIVYGLLYYGIFRFAILALNLKTPGREDVEEMADVSSTGDAMDDMILALGGADNLLVIDACTTRLRLQVVDSGRANEARLKALGARGILRPGVNTLQVVLGPQAEQVSADLKAALARGAGRVTPSAQALSTPSIQSPSASDLSALPVVYQRALGGADNLLQARKLGTRWVVRLRAAPVTRPQKDALGPEVRAISFVRPEEVHILLSPGS